MIGLSGLDDFQTTGPGQNPTQCQSCVRNVGRQEYSTVPVEQQVYANSYFHVSVKHIFV